MALLAPVALVLVKPALYERAVAVERAGPAPRGRTSSLDRYRPLIESWLDEDERNWRKQRHTAHRIWVRLRDEAGADVGESTVRNYVRRLRLERGAQREQYLVLASI